VNIQSLLEELRAERNRIDQAIAALEGLASPSSVRRGRPPKAKQAARTPGKKRRRMSVAARKRISVAMKKRWATWQGKSGPQRKRMSAAARKRVSEAMRKKWSARRAALPGDETTPDR